LLLSEFGIPRCYEDNLSAVLIEYPVIQDRIYAMAVEINSRIGDKVFFKFLDLKGLSNGRGLAKNPYLVSSILEISRFVIT